VRRGALLAALAIGAGLKAVEIVAAVAKGRLDLGAEADEAVELGLGGPHMDGEALGVGAPSANAPTAQTAQDRALAEATAFAIRIDVAEELTRLAAHLDEIERLLSKGGEAGKRLDFLIQELHREANTLGSKSQVLELTRISVEMKVLIEQMREQVQNIE
jgi:hypothetical protein